ncbi:phosphomannomutase [Enemella dayhoffiae]|uniref:Phosphomannomutase n=1 Tax=Enemella dayhoffiae TaxID=2016507 RepID=A0A255H0T3_9ACTN|nr:phospho-sugar mutase [Enemella dayhoffiae]OYO20773.1 phosphomannomutase [Enemella dayhoffiae]
MLPPELVERIDAWIAADPDPVTAAAAQDLLEKAAADDLTAVAELTDAFSGPLEFGTAGLRGPLGAGPARMNRVVVSRAAAGLAAHLLRSPSSGTGRSPVRRVEGNPHPPKGRVLIGYDARYNSEVFATDTAEILAAQGFEAILTSHPVPTPVVAFGIRWLGCVAAVVVTASHNPPQDNGYKVYLGDGSQIVPPADADIAAEIRAVERIPVTELPRSQNFRRIASELLEAYAERVAQLVSADAPREVSWVYTPLHGVGGAVMHDVIARAGFPAPVEVNEQAQPDPAFPTVSFPNPEEPGAIDLALAAAAANQVDLVIANDPDADRCAVAIPAPDAPTGFRMLHGDELGALLADDFCRRGVHGVYANSVVSGSLLHKVAAAYGQPSAVTLTGFKWIGRVPGLAFGYEEAIGYCCDPEAVADKDGISTLVTVLALAARLRADGSSIGERLDELARTHGVHLNSQWSVRVQDLSLITDAMARLRSAPPRELCGAPVEVVDLAEGWAPSTGSGTTSTGSGNALPPTDGVRLAGPAVTATVRPSGTEPKLKCYLEVRLDPTPDLARARAEARALQERLLTELRASLQL